MGTFQGLEQEDVKATLIGCWLRIGYVIHYISSIYLKYVFIIIILLLLIGVLVVVVVVVVCFKTGSPGCSVLNSLYTTVFKD